MLRALSLTFVITLVAFAGCISPADDPVAGTASTTQPVNLQTHMSVTPEGASAHTFLNDFAMGYPNRAGGTVENNNAREYLVAELETMGLEVEIHEYNPPRGINIIGIHKGVVAPEEWVVMSGHYDTAVSTVYGAFDDGAGVAAVLEMARTYSTRDWNRSMVFAFFDEEERGLLGSRAFTRDYLERDDVELVANINLDPPGLNWPCADPDGTPLPVTVVHAGDATPGVTVLMDAVAAVSDAIGIPAGAREYRQGNIPLATVMGTGASGTSDHASFTTIGVPAIFMGSSVGKSIAIFSAMTYGLHTPMDTVMQMEARCGGASLLKDAFQVILDLAYGTLVTVDSTPTGMLLSGEPSGEEAVKEGPGLVLVGGSLVQSPFSR